MCASGYIILCMCVCVCAYASLCVLAEKLYSFLNFFVLGVRINTPRKQGGLGNMNIPLMADKTLEISRQYGCLKEDEGIAYRSALFFFLYI